MTLPASMNGADGHVAKVAEQGEQIKKLAEALHNTQSKFKHLQQENVALKASGKTVGQADATLIGELAKKDELLSRMQREAKKIIDTLKSKHKEEGDTLRARYEKDLGAGKAAGGKSDPASSQGPTAHVAMLTADVGRLTAALKGAGEKLKEAEEGKDGVEVSKQFVEADLAGAREQLVGMDAKV